MKRALVTGGAGLIGSHIVDRLLEEESVEEAIVLDNFVRGRRENLPVSNPRLCIIEGDILDRALVCHAMQGVDTVFHLAALRITQCAEEPRLAFDVLAQGTFNILEAAVEAGVSKVVASSSASVYGLSEDFPTPETAHPYDNRTFYGAAKLFNEGMLRSFNDMYGLPYVALRYFNVYGPRMDAHGKYTEVMIRWMERIAAGQPPIIFGDGAQTMDFVFADDVARANVLAAKSAVSDEVFNIGRGEETSLTQLAGMLQQVMGAGTDIEYAEARAVNPVSRRLADTRKAARMLGFHAEIPLEEGLRRLVAWWQGQRGSAAS